MDTRWTKPDCLHGPSMPNPPTYVGSYYASSRCILRDNSSILRTSATMWRGIELTPAHATVSAFMLAYRSMLLPYQAVTELADLETIRKINIAENDLILWSTGLLDARKFFTPPILETMCAVPELRDYALTWERDERAADDAARERQARCEATLYGIYLLSHCTQYSISICKATHERRHCPGGSGTQWQHGLPPHRGGVRRRARERGMRW
jgi:hypothetical protein